MSTQKRVDIRINNSELIILFEKLKEQNPGLSYEGILKMWYNSMNDNGTSLLKNKFVEIHDYSTILTSNNEFPRLINLLSQIATFKPLIDSPEKCKFVCDDIESLLVTYLKNFRGDPDF